MKSKRVTLWLAVAVLAVFAMAASSPQCARSADQVLAPGLAPLAQDPIAACKNDCNASAREATGIERKRHRLAGKACNGDNACHVQEDALHNAITLEIEADRLACRINCEHQQGAGTGGQ